MAKLLDVEKVRSALKTAAKNAVSGPRELRSGRFITRNADTGRFREGDTVKGDAPGQSKQKDHR
jgi:hypothetical protein